MTSRAGRDVPVARAAGSWPGSALGPPSPPPSHYGSRLGASRRRGRGSPLPRPRPGASIQDGGAEQRQQRGGGLALQRGHGARAAAARARRLLRGGQRRPGHPGGGEATHTAAGAATRPPNPLPAAHPAPLWPARTRGPPAGPAGAAAVRSRVRRGAGGGDPRSGEAPGLPSPSSPPPSGGGGAAGSNRRR